MMIMMANFVLTQKKKDGIFKWNISERKKAEDDENIKKMQMKDMKLVRGEGGRGRNRKNTQKLTTTQERKKKYKKEQQNMQIFSSLSLHWWDERSQVGKDEFGHRETLTCVDVDFINWDHSLVSSDGRQQRWSVNFMYKKSFNHGQTSKLKFHLHIEAQVESFSNLSLGGKSCYFESWSSH